MAIPSGGFQSRYVFNFRYEMCSFSETTVEKLSKNREEYMNMSIFCRNQIARMYPSWKRFDSSNYHPLMPWAFGMQMVALNFQTPDLAMQLNNGMFSRYFQLSHMFLKALPIAINILFKLNSFIAGILIHLSYSNHRRQLAKLLNINW